MTYRQTDRTTTRRPWGEVNTSNEVNEFYCFSDSERRPLRVVFQAGGISAPNLSQSPVKLELQDVSKISDQIEGPLRMIYCHRRLLLKNAVILFSYWYLYMRKFDFRKSIFLGGTTFKLNCKWNCFSKKHCLKSFVSAQYVTQVADFLSFVFEKQCLFIICI